MQTFDDLLARHTANQQLPCAVAGVANSQGTIYTGAAGKRSLDSAQPMTTDTIVAIASMTKAVTTVATLQLVDKGTLALDEPITTYLPELANLQVLEGFEDQDKPLLSAAKSIPTARALLTHTSGYVYEIWNANALHLVTSGQLNSLFDPSGNGMTAPLAFSPGERWEYGIGIDWAGKLVEAISGKRLDVYFLDHIFTPLGMHDTFFTVPEDKAARRAAMHSRDESGLVVVPHIGDAVSGGGGLSSTVGDYLIFMRMLLNQGSLDGTHILKSATVDMMFENHLGDLEVAAGRTQMPALSNDFDMGFGAPAKWGLGFLLHQMQTEAGRPAGSVSWAGLFNTYFWIDRKNDRCAVVGSQLLPFYDQTAVALLKDFETAVYQQLEN